MDISFLTNMGDLNTHSGYGRMGFSIVTALQRLGHKVPWNDPTAPVKLNFCFPSIFVDHLNPDQHNIYLCVFESTKLKPEWYEILDQVDELWCASPWMAKNLESEGIKVHRIYNHGLDPIWSPRKRFVGDKVRFLFEGGASRKNPQMAFDAFKAAFGNRTDVQLIMKEKYNSVVREYQGKNIIGTPGGNVQVISKIYEEDQMVQLFNQAHCLVHPTSGEGWGCASHQALGTGIPAITTEECAPYVEYLGGLGLKSEYVDSPWKNMHPGQVLKPDFDDLVDKYRYVYDNIESLLPGFYRQAFKIHDRYDWDVLTAEAFENIVEKYTT